MKIFKLSLLLIVLCCLTTIAKGQNNYKVSFFIHEYEYDSIFIEGFCGSKNLRMDSIKVSKDGGFHWIAKDYPMGMYMVKSKKGDLFSFVLEQSKDFSIEIYDSGEFFVKNSPENDAYFLYQKENKKCQSAMYYYKIKANEQGANVDSLRNDILNTIDSFNVFQKSFFKTYPTNLITVVFDGMEQTAPAYFFNNGKVIPEKQAEYNFYYRTHYWNRFHFTDKRILYTPYFIKQFNSYITEATAQEPDSICTAIDDFIKTADSKGGKEYADYIIAWYLDYLPQMPFSFNEMIYSHLVNTYIDRAATYLMPSVIEYHKGNLKKIEPFLPGKLMPNIILADFNKVPHSLYSVKKNYTVLYFFASTCESCKKNLEDLTNFYNDFKDKYDVEIFSIDIDQDYAICKARQEADPYPWIVTHANEAELRPYNFQLDHTPTLYILDKDKRILNKTAIYSHVKQTIENAQNMASPKE